MLSIVIPCRNEPLLSWTIKNIWRTADVCTQIVVVDDATPIDRRDVAAEVAELSAAAPLGHTIKIIRNERIMGVGRSRHSGIMAAGCDAVLILDAHMDFDSNTWASDMVAWIAKNQTAIACTRCARLGVNRLAMADASGVQEGGAYIQERQVTSQGEARLLQGVWSRNPETIERTRRGMVAPISCMMGAAYLMSRFHYLWRLRGPWQYLRGWGVAEPTICIAQAMLGYRSWLLPITIGHVFRSREELPWMVASGDIQFNQILLAHIVYDGDRLRLALEFFKSNFGIEGNHIAHNLEVGGGLVYAKWLKDNAKIDIQEWLKEQAEREPKK